MARVVAVLLGYDHGPGVTLTRYCSSSLQNPRMALHAIKAGEGDVCVSAGVECVSRYAAGNSDAWPNTQNPLFADAQARTTATAEHSGGGWSDPRAAGLLPDVYIAMGQTAENLALVKDVSRDDLDYFGVRSQNLAEKAIANAFWAREITPVTLPSGDVVSVDDGARAGVTYEAVSGLKPVFRPDGPDHGRKLLSAHDGAAALVVMSDTMAARLGITPLARILATGVTALSPEIMGLGPVEASRQALARAGMSIGDIDLVEINEAFAAQVIPSNRDLGVDLDRLNVNGGAIAVGHPFGMTGARITTTLLNALRTHDKPLGLETMCVDGGQGMGDHRAAVVTGVAVTGAGRGIGRALAVRLAAEGARVVVNDLDAAAAERVAAQVGGLAAAGDTADEAAVAALVDRSRAYLGEIDVWFANAGVDRGKGLDASDTDWTASPEVNLLAHVPTARLLVPCWLERGGGRFVITASAGLLTMLGARLLASKHAAVAFAEWLSATYRHRGLVVQVICPQGVRTACSTRQARTRRCSATRCPLSRWPRSPGRRCMTSGSWCCRTPRSPRTTHGGERHRPVVGRDEQAAARHRDRGSSVKAWRVTELGEGAIRPLVSERVALDGVADALQRRGEGATVGRTVQP